MNLSTFTENTANPNLTYAVVKQFGRWTDFKESASDIANYGADAGVSGFIYHDDTVAFYDENYGNIHALAREMMDDLGESLSLSAFIASFSCVDLEPYEVEDAMLDGGNDDDYVTVANAMAWFALENTAREYVGQTER